MGCSDMIIKDFSSGVAEWWRDTRDHPLNTKYYLRLNTGSRGSWFRWNDYDNSFHEVEELVADELEAKRNGD